MRAQSIIFILFAASFVQADALDDMDRELFMFDQDIDLDDSMFDEFDGMEQEFDQEPEGPYPLPVPPDERDGPNPAEERVRKLKERLDMARRQAPGTDERPLRNAAIDRLKKAQQGKAEYERLKEEENAEKAAQKNVGRWASRIVAIACIILVLYWLVNKIRHREAKLTDAEISIARLTRQMDKQKEELALAKEKYHKRELDEDSFKAIVSDNQKRIIKLEVEIKNLKKKKR